MELEPHLGAGEESPPRDGEPRRREGDVTIHPTLSNRRHFAGISI